MNGPPDTLETSPVRADKWLWAARFYKTRRLATEALQAGHVRLNAERCKPSRALKPGDVLTIDRNGEQLELRVLALSSNRGNAEHARTLYLETPDSRARRERAGTDARRMTESVAPAHRPDKHERRQILKLIKRIV